MAQKIVTRIVGFAIVVNGRETKRIEAHGDMPRYSAQQAVEHAAEIAIGSPRAAVAVQILTETA